MVVNDLRILDYNNIIYCGMRTYTVGTPEAIWAMPLRPQVESNIEPERGKLRAKLTWSSLKLTWSSLPARSQLLLRLWPAVCYTVSVIWIPMVMIYRMVRFPIWPVVSDTEEDGWGYGHLILSIRCDPRIESLETNLSFMIPMEQSWILISLRDIRRLMCGQKWNSFARLWVYFICRRYMRHEAARGCHEHRLTREEMNSSWISSTYLET